MVGITTRVKSGRGGTSLPRSSSPPVTSLEDSGMDRESEDQGYKLQLWALVLETARFLLELGRLLLRSS